MKDYTFVFYRVPWREARNSDDSIKTVYIMRHRSRYAYKTARQAALETATIFDRLLEERRPDLFVHYPGRERVRSGAVQTTGLIEFITLHTGHGAPGLDEQIPAKYHGAP